MIAYRILKEKNDGNWKEIIVVLNGNTETKTLDLPKDAWMVLCKNGRIDERGIEAYKGGKVEVRKHSALILKR